MTEAPGIRLPPGFWNEVGKARRRILLLDYDGTLVPLREDRHEARLPPRVAAILSAIAGTRGEEVAVLSGRPLDELVRFLGDLPVHLVGEHGWEVRRRDGRTARHPLRPEAADALRRGAEAAEAAGMGPLLERKLTAVVLHTRNAPAGLARDLERTCRRLWTEHAVGQAVALVPMNGGLELRAAGRDKGTALAELVKEAGPGALAVYVGDDITDEDAFREVRRHGFGIRVGGDSRASLAAGRIDSCDAVERFLRDWAAALDSSGRREA
jgi:trehalose-phosphatase